MLTLLTLAGDGGVQVSWGTGHGLICFLLSAGVLVGLLVLMGRGPKRGFNDPPEPAPADDADNK